MSRKGESGVYKITNLINGKVYVGSATNLRDRKTTHLWQLKKGTHCNRYLQMAYNKYGWNNFEFSILEKCRIEDCVIIEQFYIDSLNVTNRNIGYNICPNAGSALGRKHTEETKNKIAKSNEGRKMTKEHIEILRQANLGKKHTLESRQKISIGNRGKKMSPEAKEKIKKAITGKKRTEIQKESFSKARKGKPNNITYTDELREKISISAKNRPKISEQTRQRLIDSHSICILDTNTGVFYNTNELSSILNVHKNSILRMIKFGRKSNISNRYKIV